MEKRAESNSDSLKIKARKRCGKMVVWMPTDACSITYLTNPLTSVHISTFSL